MPAAVRIGCHQPASLVLYYSFILLFAARSGHEHARVEHTCFQMMTAAYGWRTSIVSALPLSTAQRSSCQRRLREVIYGSPQLDAVRGSYHPDCLEIESRHAIIELQSDQAPRTDVSQTHLQSRTQRQASRMKFSPGRPCIGPDASQTGTVQSVLLGRRS